MAEKTMIGENQDKNLEKDPAGWIEGTIRSAARRIVSVSRSRMRGAVSASMSMAAGFTRPASPASPGTRCAAHLERVLRAWPAERTTGETIYNKLD